MSQDKFAIVFPRDFAAFQCAGCAVEMGRHCGVDYYFFLIEKFFVEAPM